MRIRTVKPEFWTDSLMVSLPRDVRLFFIGLWNVADDHGFINDDSNQIKMLLFPSDNDIDVDGFIDLLVASERLDRMVSDDGEKRFLKINHWEDHQRVDHPSKSKIYREDSRKVAIPLITRRDVAEKYGCKPGEEKKAECFYCGNIGTIKWHRLMNGKPSSWVTFSDLELDHFIPESNNGENNQKNIVLACKHCNRSKGKNNPFTFIAKTRENSRGLAPEGKGKEGNGMEEEQGKGKKRRETAKPTLEEIKEFCKEKGFKFFDCETYFGLRNDCGWENSKGRKIVNWKNDIITAQTFSNFQRKKTPEEIEKEKWDEINAFCDELSKQVL